MNGFPFPRGFATKSKNLHGESKTEPGPADDLRARRGGEATTRDFGNLLCGDFHTVQQLGEDGRILLGEAHGELGQPLVEQRAREQPHVVGQ